MDDKELIKKFQDKEFLKKNELALIAGKVSRFISQNKKLASATLIILIILTFLIPSLRWYQMNETKEFNKKLYTAQKSLKKEPLLRELIDEYKDLTATQFVRLKLINLFVEHKEKDKALTLIDEGLKSTNQDIFTTLLTLKKINMLKQDERFGEAAKEALKLESKILIPFLSKYRLLNADLFLLSGDKPAAKSLLEKVAQFQGVGAETAETSETLDNFDPVIANQASDMLLLMDLGIL